MYLNVNYNWLFFGAGIAASTVDDAELSFTFARFTADSGVV